MKKLASLFGLSLALAAGAAFADPPDGPPPGGGHRPPEAAFTACASLAEGDACTAEVHGTTETGKCVKVPAHIKEDAGKLFCGLPHPHPPRE